MIPKTRKVHHRLGQPVRAMTAVINNHRFVSLWTATSGSIPPYAGDFSEPHHRLNAFSITGVPKAIDWAIFPDWFNLTVHWRGYVPTGAAEEDWWHTLAEYIIPVGVGYRIKEKIVEWRLN